MRLISSDALSWLALIASAVALTAAVMEDYDDAYLAGATAMCRQLTAGNGRLFEGRCEVEIDGVWLTPRVEIRRPDR